MQLQLPLGERLMTCVPWDHVVEHDSRNWRCSRVSFPSVTRGANSSTSGMYPCTFDNANQTPVLPARTARRELRKRVSASSRAGEFGVRAAMHTCMSCNAMQRTHPSTIPTQHCVVSSSVSINAYKAIIPSTSID